MRPFAPADLFAIAWVSDCDISSDGSRVAVSVTRLDQEEDAYKAAVWVVDVSSGESRRFTWGNGRDFSPRWSPDGRWLAFLREPPGGKPQMAVMPASGGEARVLTTFPFGTTRFVWAPDSRRIATAARTGTAPDPDSKKAKPFRRVSTLKSRMNGEGWTYDRRQHLFVVDLGTEPAAVRQITDGDWDDSSPSWSPDSSRLAFASARHDSRDRDHWSDIWTGSVEGGEPTRLTATDGIYSAPAWSPDGSTIAFLGCPAPAGANDTLRVSASTGGTVRFVDPGFDRLCGLGPSLFTSEPPLWLDDRQLVTCAADRGDASLLLAAEGQGSRWLLRQRRTVAAYSVASTRMAFVALRADAPAELHLADLSTGEERQLTTFNDAWRATVSLSVPEKFSVQTAPGVEVDYWVMKPTVFESDRSYAVLLNIHGGPFTQYGERFFDEFQVYAGAGYGIVFCNPRGSCGQTTAFGQALIGQLGGPDFHDIMTAFDAALARMPWADRSRLGVMGGSYGGFMTSWIIGHDHRFAAAISERAVNDWYTMQGTSDIGPSFNPTFLGERAVIEDDVEAVLRQSPLTYAKNIRTPVLILHSEDDLRCPISQAEQLFVVLKRLGRDVEFVRVPDETHELSRSGRPSHRVDRFVVILEFLNRRLGAG